MQTGQTIAAISSAVGAGARMIVRISGERALPIATELGAGLTLLGGEAIRSLVWPGVRAWVYGFRQGRSYTGEDLVEFHIPGSPTLARMLLDEVIRRGARLAEAGEFTARAYFNGRIDLTQAEGVAATISAHSERELRAARQLLAGELARRLGPVMDSLAQALALVEVGIDFSDEDVTFLSAEQVRARCADADVALRTILDDSARFERLSHEPRLVLVGRPNAGKSTLLNTLAGDARAVVSDVAGTTRDVIWAEVKLKRGLVKVVDAAGLEEGSGIEVRGSAEEEIARQMRERALREVSEAEGLLLVRETGDERVAVDVGRQPDLVVWTKGDLGGQAAPPHPGARELRVSARSGEGMDLLRQRLDELAFGERVGGGGLALNGRHVAALGEARAALGRATHAVELGAEVVAMELREALDALGGVLGKMSPDDLLGRIFSEFCIGK
jgi:tRNA modification GTPase